MNKEFNDLMQDSYDADKEVFESKQKLLHQMQAESLPRHYRGKCICGSGKLFKNCCKKKVRR